MESDGALARRMSDEALSRSFGRLFRRSGLGRAGQSIVGDEVVWRLRRSSSISPSSGADSNDARIAQRTLVEVSLQFLEG